MLSVLDWLVDAFVYTFGITPPRPEQRRTVSLVLGGVIALGCVTVVALIVGMFVSTR